MNSTEKRIIKIVFKSIAVMVICFLIIVGSAFYLFWKMVQPVVATSTEAMAYIRYWHIEVPETAKDVYFISEGFQDHQTYISFTLPNNEAESFLLSAARKMDPAAALIPGNTSEFSFINRGPRYRPKKWKPDFWNLNSITDGVMFERRYWFGCVDRQTGRIYISVWNE